MSKAIEEIETIYYRGAIRSCNYACGYCPFSKKTESKNVVSKDQRALSKFFCGVKELKLLKTVFIIPYGEAMIHTYYWDCIIAFSKLDSLKSICCQTNLSFDIDEFAGKVKEKGGDFKKIKLWCSFHPTQISTENFLKQCKKLSTHKIGYSVGAVGVTEEAEAIKELRKSLPPDIYFWINGMEGARKLYTQEEIELFSTIDPLFQLEISKIKSDYANCRCGKSALFADSNGDLYNCVLCKKTIGNMYANELMPAGCSNHLCSCFLAYSNRRDIPLLTYFGGGNDIRIPYDRNRIKISFFDVDGTLTDDTGMVSPEAEKALTRLSKTVKIFLVTALPFLHAKKKCKNIFPLLSGGVFSNGGDMRIFGEYSEVIHIDNAVIEKLNMLGIRYRIYNEKKGICKITISNLSKTQCLEDLPVRIVIEDGVISLTGQQATKLKGVLRICKKLSVHENAVMVVGNSENDRELLRYFQNSIAVPAAPIYVKSAAKFVCDIKEIDAFFTMIMER